MKRGLLAMALVVLLAPAAAHAAFPGQNGKIAFARGGDIWTMNPDGTAQVNLTNTAVAENNPAWSPDGAKLAFDRIVGPAFNRQVFVMNADGTGVTPIPNTTGGEDPAWSPDGTQLAYVNVTAGSILRINLDGSGSTFVFSGDAPADPEWSPDGSRIAVTDDGPPPDCIEDIYITDAADGSNTFNLTCGLDDGEFNTYANWSPDAQRVAYGHDNTCTPGPTCFPPGITTVKLDGTGRQFVHSGETPAWSPDGTRFVYATAVASGSGRIWTVNADGTGAVDVTDGAWPDWQPIPINSYPRPKGATPTRVALTTAYQQCTAPDRTHGPPLAFPSCSSPQKASAQLTVGTGDSNGLPARDEGSVRLDTQVGAPGGPDDADVGLELFMDDVFTNALADYTGEIRAHLTLQITDKDNTPSPGGPGAATTTAIPLDVIASCAAVPDPAEGSVCSAATSADALAPGTVKEGRRSIWQLGRVEVYDGGPDGDADTPAGDSLFATQGLFVP